MEDQVNRLVEKVWDKFQTLPRSQRYLIAISGIPGSGKTTLSTTLSTRLNDLHLASSPGTASSGNVIATAIPMDGYHLTRSQLSSLPNPQNAHARRGAAFTFDGEKYLQLVRKLREPLLPETTTMYAPSFDHKKKDPVENDIPISPSMRICIFEGNYCALSKPPWSNAASLMDDIYFVSVPFPTAKRRLIRRHIEAGIASNESEAAQRADENDLVNGREIVENQVRIDEVIESREDGEWAPDGQVQRQERKTSRPTLEAEGSSFDCINLCIC
ncbi:gb [Venturia nashicola]|uniref:Gb n=1 Tax=Venturia nashicola TaxID=86259 RepID=A0A4Z1P0F1_9PEZI|nr:gb [Venturia nashicola]TLD18867.1 gb [Venturia nashicola]